MCALTANVLDRGYIENFAIVDAQVVDGAITIYDGAILNYEAANIGYVKLGSDTSSEEFAGMAFGELSVAAADNASDGTYTIKMFAKGSGKVFKFVPGQVLTTAITIANIGDEVEVAGDDKIALASVTSNDVALGTIVHVDGGGNVYVVI